MAKAQVKKEEHIHQWIGSGGNVCLCGTVQVTSQEYDLDKSLWDTYHHKVLETTAYKNFQLMREAIKKGDLPEIHRLKAIAKKQIDEKSYELKKPLVFDVETLYNNGKCVII